MPVIVKGTVDFKMEANVMRPGRVAGMKEE